MDLKNNDMTFGVRKDLPFTEFFNIEIRKMKSSGILDLLFKRKSGDSVVCEDQDIHKKDAKFVQIGFEKVNLLFIIMFCGIILALLTIIMEYFHQKIKKNMIIVSVGSQNIVSKQPSKFYSKRKLVVRRRRKSH